MQLRLKTRIVFVMMGTLALAGCGGGDGGGGSSAAPPTTTTSTTVLTGKAIDGYLSNATVCFDNGQGTCDATQATTTTDSTGSYSLAVSGSATGKKVDVIVTPSTTDLSNPGAAFTSTFTLSAVVSGTSQNITPLTTMVVAQMTTGQTQAQATQAVQALVGSGVDPNADYIANSDSATTAIAASMVSHMTALGGQGSISWTQVEATMNAYLAKGNINGVEQSDVDTQLTNPAFSTEVSASPALASPLYTVDGDLIPLILNSTTPLTVGLSPVRENTSLSGSTLFITQEVQSDGDWTAASPVGSYDAFFSGNFISLDAGLGEYEMEANGSWTAFLTPAQLHPSYALSTVGSSLVGTDPNTNDTVTVSYHTTDVSNQPLSSALQIDYRNPVREAMTGSFPSGTTAYLMTISHANDQLVLTSNGFGTPWISGADTPGTPTMTPSGVAVYGLGNAGQVYTSIQQAIGTQTDIAGGCFLLNIQAGGIATVTESGASSCNYTGEPISFPVTGSWSVYARNPNVITISLPSTIGAANVPINDTIKNTINAGGSLVVALVNGQLLSGYMIPSTSPTTSAQFNSTQVDTIAAAMRTAATAIGQVQNP